MKRYFIVTGVGTDKETKQPCNVESGGWSDAFPSRKWLTEKICAENDLSDFVLINIIELNEQDFNSFNQH